MYYVPVGIDHGTTNSAIAVLEEDGPQILKPNPTEWVMPSAVYFDKYGRCFVGREAYNAMMSTEEFEGEGYDGYKLKIGQNDVYHFKAAGKTLKGQEMGAKVIERLCHIYREAKNEDLKACVITIPANFEESDFQGTERAAKMAGLKYVTFLSEPIAAAFAYGFLKEDSRGICLVYDIGGGTFDVSLIAIQNGRKIVLGHKGVRRLGGRDFDRELLDYVLGPKKEDREKWEKYKKLNTDYFPLRRRYSLEGFTGENPVYKTAWRRLLLAIETAKIELSRTRESTVEIIGELCRDEAGKPVTVEFNITREIYETLISSYIQRTIYTSDLLLQENRISVKDLEGVILIGGPTNTPALKEAVSEWFGRDPSTSINPMTAVAQGAAIFANTLEVPDNIYDFPRISEDLRIPLYYERNSKIKLAAVEGKVENFGGNPKDLSVEIVRKDKVWTSERVQLREDGTFSLEVHLAGDGIKPQRSSFVTRIFKGGQLVAETEEPVIWYPSLGDKTQDRISHSMRIGLVDNDTAILVGKDVTLPAEVESNDFITAKNLAKEEKNVLRIPILQGVSNHITGKENSRADCCVHVGSIIVETSEMKRDLPKGSEVQITIQLDRSRKTYVEAYIPLLNQTFTAEFQAESYGQEAELESVVERFKAVEAQFKECESLHSREKLDEAEKYITIIKKQSLFEEVEKQISRAQEGERDALYRAYKEVLALQGDVNTIIELQKPIRLKNKLGEIERIAQPQDKDRVMQVKGQLEALSLSEKEKLKEVEKTVGELEFKIRMYPYMDLVLDLIALKDKRGTDQQIRYAREAEDLLERIEQRGGIGALTEEDLQMLKDKHQQLIREIPELSQWRQKAIEKIPRPEEMDFSGIASKLKR